MPTKECIISIAVSANVNSEGTGVVHESENPQHVVGVDEPMINI